VIESASHVTTVNYKVAVIDGDVSALLGRSGQEFCAGLRVFDTYKDPSPQPPDTGI